MYPRQVCSECAANATKISLSLMLRLGEDTFTPRRFQRNHEENLAGQIDAAHKFGKKSFDSLIWTINGNIIMPRGSGNSGYNSQGNHYNTPGGTNSNNGSSYHCKSSLSFHPTLFRIEHQWQRLNTVGLLQLTQTRTLMVRTTTRMTTEVPTTTRARAVRRTRLQVERNKEYPNAERSKEWCQIFWWSWLSSTPS